MKKSYSLTPEGKQELETELEALKSSRLEIAEKIANARDYGDLRENSEYSEARNEQSQVESRIAEIEDILQNATLIKDAAKPTKVTLGVNVNLESGKKKVSYTIVGSVEADPLEGKISDESPIGKALLGKKVGDSVVINAPSGEITYNVVSLG